MGFTYGESMNWAVTKLLILLVVNEGAKEGDPCVNVLSASHAGR
jgi:hypothetical protein